MNLLLLLLMQATPLSVKVDGCELNAEKVRSLAELELHARPANVKLSAKLTCRDDTFDIEVDDPLTAKTLLRHLSVKDLTNKAAERFAALALTELVAASWSELLLDSRTRAQAAPREAQAAVINARVHGRVGRSCCRGKSLDRCHGFCAGFKQADGGTTPGRLALINRFFQENAARPNVAAGDCRSGCDVLVLVSAE